MDIDLAAGMNTGMYQCLRQRLIRLGQVNILTHQRNLDRPLRMLQMINQTLPYTQVRGSGQNVQFMTYDLIEHLIVQ